MTDDFVPKPVPPPLPARPVGPASGKPPGIQPSRPMADFVQKIEAMSAGSKRARKAWATRRAKAAARDGMTDEQAGTYSKTEEMFDRHRTGTHPYDIALDALHAQIAKIKNVIKTLEELKGG